MKFGFSKSWRNYGPDERQLASQENVVRGARQCVSDWSRIYAACAITETVRYKVRPQKYAKWPYGALTECNETLRRYVPLS